MAEFKTPDLERLAAQAGFRIFNGRIVAADGGISGEATASLERLAQLVRADERERCARACEEIAYDLRNHDLVRLSAVKCLTTIRNSASCGAEGERDADQA